MNRSLLVTLSAGNFVVGFGAFVIVGLVAAIAQRFGVTPSDAGRLMTWYAVAYAIGSPVLVALTGGFARRTVVTAGMALFLAGAIGSFIGGASLASGGFTLLAWVASGIALFALAWLVFSDRVATSRG
jgi:MFS transporter, DHA1 family, inner membrane transport protein